MTRQDAIAQILAIVDGARPPAAPAIDDVTSDASSKKSAARQRGADSLPSPESSADTATSQGSAEDGTVVPFSRPLSAAGVLRDSASSQTGGSADSSGKRKRGARKADSKDDLDLRLAREMAMTDLGNAQRFVARNRERFLWCAVIGWLWWDGKRWASDGADEKVKMAEHDCVLAIADEARALKGTKWDKIVGHERDGTPIRRHEKLYKWATASQAASKLAPIARHAAPYLAVEAAALDADPYAVNVNNGTLIVRKRDDGGDYIRRKDHDPADLITKLAPVDYDPTADAPQFDKFFAEIQRDPDTRAFLLRWLGYSLLGDTSEQKLCVFWGKGRNGKSVLIDTCAYIAGDYAETVPIETFLAEGRGRSAGQATPDLAILPGKRALRTSEPSKGASLDEALIKLATGGEPIQARHLNRGFFKFYPVFKLTISGNYRPKIGGTDEGIWGRVVLVPFLEFIPPERRDPQLATKLRDEASGILNRLLDGLRAWLDKGLVPPKEVVDATADYRRDSDQLGRFLDPEAGIVQRCDPTEGARVQSSVLLRTFNAWARAGGGSEWKPRGFSDAMTERGFRKDKSSTMFWLDIKLIKTEADFVDSEGRPRSVDDDRGPPGGRTGDDDEEIRF